MDAEIEITTKRLDHLPIIAQAVQRLRLRELVDERCPVDPRSHVTTGQCVEALVTTILSGSHTLYRLSDLLSPLDLFAAFGWTVEPERFHDERIARALDALVEAGLAPINAAATFEAVRAYALDLSRVHFDTTSVKVHGAYLTSEEPEDEDDPEAIPHLTRGYSKDHRPDLKQIVYGLTVTGDGAVPIYGRAASGDRNDSLETRFAMHRLGDVLPDPRATTLVGDSKLFAGETLLLARDYGFRYVTLMPRRVGLWAEVHAAYRAARASGKAPALLKEKGDDRWEGLSQDVVYKWKDADKKEHDIPLRALVVESSRLREEKRASLERQRKRERAALEKAIAKLAKGDFECAADAEKDARELAVASAPRFHRLEPRVRLERRPVKRAHPGRPRKDDPREMKDVFAATLEIVEAPEVFEEELHREGCFVLATTLAKAEHPDAAVFEAYQEQHLVERCMHWMKGPLEVAPIFLKTPTRVAALGVVYVLALMVYALIQREVRARLAEVGETIPGNDNRRTDRPTTEVVFRLFEGIFAVRAGGMTTVTNMTTEQARLLELLGNTSLARPGVRVAAPQPPASGQRGHKTGQPSAARAANA